MSQEVKTLLDGELSKNEVAAFKAKYPGLFAIKNASGKIAYFRKPELDEINMATAQFDPNTPLNFVKDLMNECYVAGSRDIIDNHDDFMGAQKHFSAKLEGTKSELVEL